MLAQESRAALAAVSFLTRIPLGVDLDGDDVRRGAAYFPLVGAGVGAVTGLTARWLGAPAALGAQTVLTGALHLDALADSADALGTNDRERALEIMRDSRIGSFGTAAMSLNLMIKASALQRCDHGVSTAIAAGVLSRTVPVVLSSALPYARPSGTAQALSTGSAARAGAAVGLAAALVLGLARDDRSALGVAALVGAASAGFWQRKLGGMTGDTLGASIELTESAILLWRTPRRPRGRPAQAPSPEVPRMSVS